ncbi:MAG TPA: carboxypeptidase-like regulatory domain-containing protein, partial [Thermoanaerobaculia bacterium]|nr:carboxypeptidase-like regulatory domain-containing protein [Thermoanaerobaculia bacterium]
VGSVRHADGRPASGAHVWVHPLEAPGGDWSGATADAAGRFRLTGTAPGAVRVFARLDSGGHTEAEAIAGDGAEVDLVLAPPTGVSGRVVGADGVPVPNAMVSLHHEHGSQGRSVDGAGRFEVLDLDPGTYRLSAQAPGSGYAAHPEPIVLAEGTEVRDLVLRLEMGASVVGRVLGLSAGELSRLRVAARRTGGDFLRVEGAVGGDGTFEIRGLPLGTYRVSATLLDTRRSGEVAVELAADERREGIEIDLSGLRLAVEARLNGQPAPGTLAIAGDGTWQRVRSLGLGRFLFEGLRPGTYRLGLLPDPGVPWLQEDVEVLGDGEVAVDFAAWPVEGWVVDAAGAPVAGMAIQLAPAAPNAIDFPARHDRAPRTDAGGRFVLPLVPSGSWQLTAVGDDGRRAIHPVEVPPGGLGGLTLVLGPPPPPPAPAPAAPGS